MKSRAVGGFALLLAVAAALLLGAPCLEVRGPIAAQNVLAPGEWLGQEGPAKAPPFIGGLRLQARWSYSDLVCAGMAEPREPINDPLHSLVREVLEERLRR